MCRFFNGSYHFLAEQFWRKGADKSIKLWDVATGEFIQTLQGHLEGISDIAWSSDGEHLASASDDKTIRIWSLEEVRRSNPGQINLRVSVFLAC